MPLARPYTVVAIVPTGVGAAIGGYAGDALPVARAIAQVADRAIAHPNVLNGAQLYWPEPNLLYVEGYGLDRFAAGEWGLRPVRCNRIVPVLDAGMEPELRWRHAQAADAARATLGLEVGECRVTDAPLEVTLRQAPSGASWGTLGNPDSLLHAAERAIRDDGAEAIAAITRFPDGAHGPQAQAYRHGQGVDPLAGAEAVISHLVVRTFGLPCAHAPALAPLPVDAQVAPRAAAEELGYTFLPSVLVGLARAPQFATQRTAGAAEAIWADAVDAVVTPADACGGSALLGLSDRGARIVSVAQNATRMQVPPERLGMAAIPVHSYLEALGVLVAQRAGLDETALHLP